MAREGEAAQFVLAVGDLHVPQRAADLPPQFREYLDSGRIGHVLCTGNVGDAESFEALRRIAAGFSAVRGDADELEGLPELRRVSIAGFGVLLLHGHQLAPWDDDAALLALAREHDADIVVSGHTHRQSVREASRVLLVNPGSATGAFSAVELAPPPAFVLLKLAPNGTADVYLYRCGPPPERRVQIEKRPFTRAPR